MKAVSLVAAGVGGCRFAVVRPRMVRSWTERRRKSALDLRKQERRECRNIETGRAWLAVRTDGDGKRQGWLSAVGMPSQDGGDHLPGCSASSGRGVLLPDKGNQHWAGWCHNEGEDCRTLSGLTARPSPLVSLLSIGQENLNKRAALGPVTGSSSNGDDERVPCRGRHPAPTPLPQSGASSRGIGAGRIRA